MFYSRHTETSERQVSPSEFGKGNFCASMNVKFALLNSDVNICKCVQAGVSRGNPFSPSTGSEPFLSVVFPVCALSTSPFWADPSCTFMLLILFGHRYPYTDMSSGIRA